MEDRIPLVVGGLYRKFTGDNLLLIYDCYTDEEAFSLLDMNCYVRCYKSSNYNVMKEILNNGDYTYLGKLKDHIK